MLSVTYEKLQEIIFEKYDDNFLCVNILEMAQYLLPFGVQRICSIFKKPDPENVSAPLNIPSSY